MSPDWIKQACNLYYQEGQGESEQLVRDTIKGYIKSEDFSSLDKDIFYIVIDRIPIRLLIAILEETKDFKANLIYRKKFFESVEKRALDRCEWSIQLFSGLR